MNQRIVLVAGARPNFVKIAILMKHLKANRSIETVLVHTGQHYDYQLSDIFFKELNIPKPQIFLKVGQATPISQISTIMSKFERVLLRVKPDLVIVVGDVNSTIACALATSKMQIKLAHIESGLRSFDKSMPEENNRLVTDALSDYLFVSEPSGLQNLKREGIDQKKIYFVGNVMIDALRFYAKSISKSKILSRLALKKRGYCVLTLHRPSNVDNKQDLVNICNILELVSQRIKMVYPVHPRTKKMFHKHGLLSRIEKNENLMLIDPVGYIDFMMLIKQSVFVLTDSGGIQEESTVLKIPCLTMRKNTERPITVELGTSVLVGTQLNQIIKHVNVILKGRWKRGGRIPKLWDGNTSCRIMKTLDRIAKSNGTD
jgi:UDP-N-acetylglucosamine 2-epimerase (non-hydrolysing)